MTKIGILTCSNTTGDLGCSSTLCLEEMYEGSSLFEMHKEKEGAQLAGIINCAGCPTAVAPEKILGRVRMLAAAGVEAIHISSCIMALCPFRAKYIGLLEEHFPEVKIIQGTHGPAPGATLEMFVKAVKEILCREKPSIADMGPLVAEQMAAVGE